MQGQGKREIHEETRRPAASSSTIPTCEKPGPVRLGGGGNDWYLGANAVARGEGSDQVGLLMQCKGRLADGWMANKRCKVQGYHLKKQKGDTLYRSLRTAIRPVLHGPGIHVPSPPDNSDDVCEELETNSETCCYSGEDEDFACDAPPAFHTVRAEGFALKSRSDGRRGGEEDVIAEGSLAVSGGSPHISFPQHLQLDNHVLDPIYSQRLPDQGQWLRSPTSNMADKNRRRPTGMTEHEQLRRSAPPRPRAKLPNFSLFSLAYGTTFTAVRVPGWWKEGEGGHSGSFLSSPVNIAPLLHPKFIYHLIHCKGWANRVRFLAGSPRRSHVGNLSQVAVDKRVPLFLVLAFHHYSNFTSPHARKCSRFSLLSADQLCAILAETFQEERRKILSWYGRPQRRDNCSLWKAEQGQGQPHLSPHARPRPKEEPTKISGIITLAELRKMNICTMIHGERANPYSDPDKNREEISQDEKERPTWGAYRKQSAKLRPKSVISHQRRPLCICVAFLEGRNNMQVSHRDSEMKAPMLQERLLTPSEREDENVLGQEGEGERARALACVVDMCDPTRSRVVVPGWGFGKGVEISGRRVMGGGGISWLKTGNSLRPVAPLWLETRSEIGSRIDTENCCTIRVQSWTGDRDEFQFKPPKLVVRNLDPRSAAIVGKSKFVSFLISFSHFGTKIDESEIQNHEISLVQHFYIGTKIKLDPCSELGAFDLGSGKMLVQPDH
ncbi:hypothetical protein PR048_032187 [Dryococelus australis]|uniref:Uncharacterized protein n=1 Tax=Dryococelus australis TaxID=614101 RepID=A0ABQ9G1I7_9NEOP|nr:hypothetical protein PR048_032187 [Dryococelus australis]